MTDLGRKPPSTGYFIRLGFSVIAVTFGGFALWSVAAPIEGAVVAPGQIVVENSRKTIQHLEGGVVDEILVKEGDRVDAGQVIARLAGAIPKANLAMTDGQLTELYARRARLEAERDRAPAIGAARGLAEIVGAEAFEQKLAGQSQLLEARNETRGTQISLLEERVIQQRERIGGLNAQIRSQRDQQRLIEDELAGVRELHEQGFAPLTKLRALERESKRLGGERGALQASVAEAESVIAEARLEIERLKETGREEAIKELRDVEASIAELEERRVAAHDAVDRTEIRAPKTGRVLGLSVHTVGGVVAPGGAIMEIVPDDDRLQIAARVSPQDIDKVAVGMSTRVRFSALNSTLTPEASGSVASVSADSLVDKNTGIPFYLVLVDIPDTAAIEKKFKGQEIVPGMPVEAYIRTGSRSAASYFLKPLTDALSRSMREE
jgi:HlyD family type I secretion membrane fusion protein